MGIHKVTSSPATTQIDTQPNNLDELDELVKESEVSKPNHVAISEALQGDASVTPLIQLIASEEAFAWMQGTNNEGMTKAALMAEAIKRVPQLAQLDRQILEVGLIGLSALGVSQTWIDRSLRPLIKDACPTAFKRISWQHYVSAATDLGYSFRINEMSDNLECNGKPMTDVDEATLLSLLHERDLGDVDVARRAFVHAGSQNRYHPIKQYLEKLEWDGQDHIDSLCAYFTDAHDPITYKNGTLRGVFHAVMHRWFIGAVAKIYEPDKAQNIMPIFDGLQGKGKSYFVQYLCPLPELFIEKSIEPGNKDFDAFLVENWIWEVPELGALMRKADREALKGFLTTTRVKYRPPYARKAIQKPAAASFIGTVNFEGALLSDPTGHRRFFPIKLTNISHAYSSEIDIHQVWAQAMALYQGGESWKLCPEEAKVHSKITETYEVDDVLESMIHKWFDVYPDDTDTFTITADIIERLRTHAGVKETDKALAMHLSQTLHRMGLKREKRMINGKRGWGYLGISPNLRPSPY